jgi:hypothetical protein
VGLFLPHELDVAGKPVRLLRRSQIRGAVMLTEGVEHPQIKFNKVSLSHLIHIAPPVTATEVHRAKNHLGNPLSRQSECFLWFWFVVHNFTKVEAATVAVNSTWGFAFLRLNYVKKFLGPMIEDLSLPLDRH